MPTRLKRYYNVKHLHFLICSCYHRLPFLSTPQRRDLFLKVLEQARRRYRFTVVGYVVMPEHIHLLISEPDQWRWSSFWSYAFGERGAVRVNFQEWPLQIKKQPRQTFGESMF